MRWHQISSSKLKALFHKITLICGSGCYRTFCVDAIRRWWDGDTLDREIYSVSKAEFNQTWRYFQAHFALGIIWLSNNIMFTLYSQMYELAVMQNWVEKRQMVYNHGSFLPSNTRWKSYSSYQLMILVFASLPPLLAETFYIRIHLHDSESHLWTQSLGEGCDTWSWTLTRWSRCCPKTGRHKCWFCRLKPRVNNHKLKIDRWPPGRTGPHLKILRWSTKLKHAGGKKQSFCLRLVQCGTTTRLLWLLLRGSWFALLLLGYWWIRRALSC